MRLEKESERTLENKRNAKGSPFQSEVSTTEKEHIGCNADKWNDEHALFTIAEIDYSMCTQRTCSVPKVSTINRSEAQQGHPDQMLVGVAVAERPTYSWTQGHN